MAFTGLNYNAPTQTNSGTASSIDGAGNNQMETFFYLKKAIIYARKQMFFSPLASVVNMPKNFGKTIKVYAYVPLLDTRNVNSQGLNAAGATIANGNLYGSSRDIGTINANLPALTEGGGRVNRVGFTRLVRQGSLFKFGFFTEFTQESMDFDSDAELMDHLSTELMNGAVQLTEAVLQRDLLGAAGVILYGGAAVADNQVTGEGATPTLVSYKNIIRLDQILTNNRTPKQTTIINGSRLIDTMTIPASRVMFIGNELLPVVKGMTDLFGGKAFIPVQHYADAGTVLNGEIGSIDSFRIIQVPEMLHWAGVGAAATSGNPGYRTSIMSGGVATLNGDTDVAGGSGANYDVFPMLVIGDDSFTTIGWQTDGKSVKFSVMTKMPGRETAQYTDPYGEMGFSSVKWYYGFLVKYPERIGLIKTVAPV
jgi:N4-gp56 family major capsid protein